MSHAWLQVEYWRKLAESLRVRLADLWARCVAWFRAGGPKTIVPRLRNLGISATWFTGKLSFRALVRIGNLRLVTVFRWVVIAAIVAGVAISTALFIAVRYPSTQIPEHDPVDQMVYLDQGWGANVNSAARQKFYYTPQGTTLFQMRYSWFVNLEESWGRKRFARAENMRALGFLTDDSYTYKNPDQLPIGFAKHYDPALNTDVLDITCAACHTGELDIRTKDRGHVGIRIDGGPAMHAFTAMSIGNFAPTLLAAMGATLSNPLKFDRFAQAVLGEKDYRRGRLPLYVDFFKVFWAMFEKGLTDTRKHLYPVDEGFGRTDAMGRISNQVFAQELDESNYRVGNAPVSYPAIWDIWKFDWVQYTAAVAQPMARNVIEAQGVGAVLSLTDPYGLPLPPGQRFTSTADVENLHEIENLLVDLKAPTWPEQILGKVDHEKANAGKKLYQDHCAHCHEPCELDAADRGILVPGKTPSQPHWRLNAIPVEDIGTDPTAALNFVNNYVDLTRTGITEQELRPKIKAVYDEYMARENKYKQNVYGGPPMTQPDINQKLDAIDLKKVPAGAALSYIGAFLRNKYYDDNHFSLEKRADYDGFGRLDLPQVELVYKARPLAGVWATAPYLHNGSVPTLYEMLIPADQRRKKFFVGRREFDPVRVGILAQPLSKNGFWLDTSIPGNLNTGHEFRAGYREWKPCDPPSHGVIGPELKEEERWAIIEYLKIRSDDPAPPCARKPPPPSPVACPVNPAVRTQAKAVRATQVGARP